MNLSRIISILSTISAGAAALALYTQQINPSTAVIAMGISVVLNAVTERIQGGASKAVQLTEDERAIIESYREGRLK